MRNAISIDLEEWFHPEILRGHFQISEWQGLEPRAPRVVDRLLEILAEANVSATFFVLGWVALQKNALHGRASDGIKLTIGRKRQESGYDLQACECGIFCVAIE